MYRSANIVRVIKSRRLRWAGLVARMEESRSAFKMLTGKPTGKRLLRRPRCRWEDIIKMDLNHSSGYFPILLVKYCRTTYDTSTLTGYRNS